MKRLNIKVEQEYFFTTTVSEEFEKEDFLVEFFIDSPNPLTEEMPIKITRDFDELIDFFEQLDE